MVWAGNIQGLGNFQKLLKLGEPLLDARKQRLRGFIDLVGGRSENNRILAHTGRRMSVTPAGMADSSILTS